MNQEEFAVIPFENRNGSTSFRVVGWLYGLRIRKNFKTREEAAAEKQSLEIKAAQTAQGMRSVATVMTVEQVREAETVFRRIRTLPRSLAFYVDFALGNYKEPDEQKQLADAVAEYRAAKQREFEQDQLSPPQILRIGWEMTRLTKHFKSGAVAEVTSVKLTTYLEAGRGGMKTHNNRREMLSTFFKFCFQRGWVAENPVLKVPHFRIRRKRSAAVTLSAARAAEIMEFLEKHEDGIWVPYFALCLFAGIRPAVPHGEITKLKPEMIDLEAGLIHVSAEVSKVREARKIQIHPNLAAWLRTYPLKKLPIIVGNFKKRRDRFAKKLGLSHDVLRHTFISMFVAKYRSIGEAAIQAGNSEAVIRKHYLDLKLEIEAEAFFGILPKHAKVITAPQTVIVAIASACGAIALVQVSPSARWVTAGLSEKPSRRALPHRAVG